MFGPQTPANMSAGSLSTATGQAMSTTDSPASSLEGASAPSPPSVPTSPSAPNSPSAPGAPSPPSGPGEVAAQVLSHWAESDGQSVGENTRDTSLAQSLSSSSVLEGPSGLRRDSDVPVQSVQQVQTPTWRAGQTYERAESVGERTERNCKSQDAVQTVRSSMRMRAGTGELAPAFRVRMEKCFGESFSNVEVRRGLSSQDQWLGARAVAERERITVDTRILDTKEQPESQLVLAEEFAHVLQKRRGHVVPDPLDALSREREPHGQQSENGRHRESLEQEAKGAATAALSGAKPAIAAGSHAPVRQYNGVELQQGLLGKIGVASAQAGLVGDEGGGATPVGQIGAVFDDGGVYLRDAPNEKTSRILTKLAFATRFFAESELSGGWYKVRVLSGGSGYVAKHLVRLAPEPGARLHKIQAGESVIGIAEGAYKKAVRGDEDLRFYVNVLSYVNPTAIPKPTQDASWKTAKALKNFAIWIPSVEFARTLHGTVGSGSITGGLWAKVRDGASYVVKKILEGMPGGEQVVAWLNRVGPQVAKIFNHPGRFLGNLMEAIKQGFHKFTSNIGTNIEKSVISLLTDSVAGQGIAMPRRFDSQGILGLSLSVLGISRASIEQKLISRGVPASAFQRLEQAAELKNYFADIRQNGLAPVLMGFLDQADALKETIFGALKDWLTTQVIRQGLMQLASILVPGGGLVQLAIKIYDTVMFIIDKMKMIASVVSSITASLASIVDGNIEGAAARVEHSLQTGLTLALGFLASMARLGSVAKKVKEVLSSIRARVDLALNKLVQFIADKAQRLLGNLSSSKNKSEPAKHDAKDEAKATHKAETKAPPKDPDHDKKVNEGLKQIDVEEEKLDPDKDNKLTRDQAERVAKQVKAKHPIFTNIIAHYDVAQSQITYEWFASHGSHRSRRTPYSDELEPATFEGTRKNPFPIDWPKPAAKDYPTLYFGAVRGGNDPMPQSTLRTLLGKKDDKGVVVRAYQPRSKSTLAGGEEIGLDQQYQIRTDLTFGPLTKETTPRQTPNPLKKILEKYGYRGKDDGMECEHLVDLQIGGPDAVCNLWPLEENRHHGTGRWLTNYKIKLSSGKEIQIFQLRQHVAKTGRKYFFKIQSTK